MVARVWLELDEERGRASERASAVDQCCLPAAVDCIFSAHCLPSSARATPQRHCRCMLASSCSQTTKQPVSHPACLLLCLPDCQLINSFLFSTIYFLADFCTLQVVKAQFRDLGYKNVYSSDMLPLRTIQVAPPSTAQSVPSRKWWPAPQITYSIQTVLRNRFIQIVLMHLASVSTNHKTT